MGRYNNPVPTRFLISIDFSKIPALTAYRALLERFGDTVYATIVFLRYFSCSGDSRRFSVSASLKASFINMMLW